MQRCIIQAVCYCEVIKDFLCKVKSNGFWCLGCVIIAMGSNTALVAMVDMYRYTYIHAYDVYGSTYLLWVHGQ